MRHHDKSVTEAEKNALYSVFRERYSELYWLAFLLTGDQQQSVQAFTNALDAEDGANPFFRSWMVSWARRLVIASALRVIASQLRESVRRVELSRFKDLVCPDGPPPATWTGFQGLTKPEVERAVLAIDLFPRCALLLTVFERLSVQDTAVLLGAEEALVRKAQGLGLIELTRNIARGRGWNCDHNSEMDVGELQHA